jgi:voltage-gated potassium channel
MTIRERIRRIVFETDTFAGKLYDLLLIAAVVLSVGVVMVDSVRELQIVYGPRLREIEWFFTLLFTLDYFVRLWCAQRPVHYAGSFFGIVDFLSVIPTYLRVLFPDVRYLVAIRFLRMLRIFKVLSLAGYVNEFKALSLAVSRSARKITVFLFTVMTIAVVLGSLMYVIEGEANGFTSIPRSIYWGIVTLTTVGYGDISPQTPLGQVLASLMMVLGYSLIVVPIGIVSVDVVEQHHNGCHICPACGSTSHDVDARFCKNCGSPLGDTAEK